MARIVFRGLSSNGNKSAFSFFWLLYISVLSWAKLDRISAVNAFKPSQSPPEINPASLDASQLNISANISCSRFLFSRPSSFKRFKSSGRKEPITLSKNLRSSSLWAIFTDLISTIGLMVIPITRSASNLRYSLNATAFIIKRRFWSSV